MAPKYDKCVFQLAPDLGIVRWQKKTLVVGGEENGGESAVKRKGAGYEYGWLCLLQEEKKSMTATLFLSQIKHPANRPSIRTSLHEPPSWKHRNQRRTHLR